MVPVDGLTPLRFVELTRCGIPNSLLALRANRKFSIAGAARLGSNRLFI
jgi:hypothetical protein